MLNTGNTKANVEVEIGWNTRKYEDSGNLMTA